MKPIPIYNIDALHHKITLEQAQESNDYILSKKYALFAILAITTVVVLITLKNHHNEKEKFS